MRKKQKKRISITKQKDSITKISKKQGKPFSFRMLDSEKQYLESKRKELGFSNPSIVLHYILGQARLIEEKYQSIVREQEDQKRRFKL